MSGSTMAGGCDIVKTSVWGGVRLCCHCLLCLLPVIHRTEAIAITTEPVTTNNQDNSAAQQAADDKSDMLKGLAAGFGFFFGLLILVCIIWCLCCGNVCNSNDENGPEKRLKSNAKVSPSPPRSANVVRTRPKSVVSP